MADGTAKAKRGRARDAITPDASARGIQGEPIDQKAVGRLAAGIVRAVHDGGLSVQRPDGSPAELATWGRVSAIREGHKAAAAADVDALIRHLETRIPAFIAERAGTPEEATAAYLMAPRVLAEIRSDWEARRDEAARGLAELDDEIGARPPKARPPYKIVDADLNPRLARARDAVRAWLDAPGGVNIGIAQLSLHVVAREPVPDLVALRDSVKPDPAHQGPAWLACAMVARAAGVGANRVQKSRAK